MIIISRASTSSGILRAIAIDSAPRRAPKSRWRMRQSDFIEAKARQGRYAISEDQACHYADSQSSSYVIAIFIEVWIRELHAD
ncbi:MAG: hypothetical protein R3D26_07700 [Cyanobacteriota/Melainabacteria group bacterium]